MLSLWPQKQWGEIAQKLGSFVEDWTRHRIFGLGLGPETMRLLNFAELTEPGIG